MKQRGNMFSKKLFKNFIYCTCISECPLSLALVNDQASLEKLQETGRLLSLRYNHLQRKKKKTTNTVSKTPALMEKH